MAFASMCRRDTLHLKTYSTAHHKNLTAAYTAPCTLHPAHQTSASPLYTHMHKTVPHLSLYLYLTHTCVYTKRGCCIYGIRVHSMHWRVSQYDVYELVCVCIGVVPWCLCVCVCVVTTVMRRRDSQ